MVLSEGFFRLSAMLGFVIVLLVILFGYLFFEPYITGETITIKVLNKAQFGNEPGKYFVFTQDEVFYNSNDYYQNKEEWHPGTEHQIKNKYFILLIQTNLLFFNRQIISLIK